MPCYRHIASDQMALRLGLQRGKLHDAHLAAFTTHPGA
jgi:hypothetical protein